MRNTEGEKQNGGQQASVSSVLDDCDVEYDVEVNSSGKYYESVNENIANISRTVQVSRNVLFTEKTIQALLKHGRLTNREKFLWNFNNWAEKTFFRRFIVAVSAALGSLILIWLLSPFASFFFAVFICIAYLSGEILAHHAANKARKVKERIREECTEPRKIELPLPWSTEGLYKFVTALKNDELTADEKKQIFEMLEGYPSEVNEQILKLRKTKEELPQNNREAEMVFHEVNAALKKLFALREVPKNKRALNKVLEIFNIAMERKVTTELGPAIANLSDASEFLNVATNDPEVAEVVSALSATVSDDEATVQEYSKNNSYQRKSYSWRS